jgi:hypothetical protein
MTTPIVRDPAYRTRAVDADATRLCARWSVSESLSYRDLVEMTAGRRVQVGYSTILRSSVGMSRSLRSAGTDSREGSTGRREWTRRTSRSRPGGTTRIAPSTGTARPSRAQPRHRGHASILSQGAPTTAPRVPYKATLDRHVPGRRALWLLQREPPSWRNVKVRTTKCLNNVVEQDDRAIKRRCASMTGFKSFANARSRSPAFGWRIAFGRDGSHLTVAVGAVAGRETRNARWHSHRSPPEAPATSSRAGYPAMHQDPLQDHSIAGSQRRADIELAVHAALLPGAHAGAVRARPSSSAPADRLLLT